MNKDDFFIKSQIESDIQDTQRLLATGVFENESLAVFQEPVFVSIMLKLNDLLQKFNKLGHRITFTDDISTVGIDITELVRVVRNAIGHLDSDENFIQDTEWKFVFNTARGKGAIVSIGGKTIGSDYEDDLAFFYGDYRLYLKRHIARIVAEAVEVYKTLYA